MKINQKGLNLIKEFEGCELKVYKDIVGILTVGYGHVTKLALGTVITEEEANKLLDDDIKKFEDGINQLVKTEINDNQFSALVCFTFNVGLEAFKNSTLLKKLNNKDYEGASKEFPRWNMAGGKVVKGLIRRREAEKKLFLS